jgi:ketosteroid isomerase-like protein
MIRLALLLALALQPSAGNDFNTSREQWAHNLHDKHVDALVAQYDPEAHFHGPGGAVTRGTGALRHLFQAVADTIDSDLTFLDHHSEISGNMAYDSGIFRDTVVTRATGQKRAVHGTYLTVYRKDADGRWLIIQQAWTIAPSEATPFPER